MEETVEKKINKLNNLGFSYINSLVHKACILLVISFVGIAFVIRGDLIGEKDILYVFGYILGMVSAIIAGMMCFFILGIKKGIKIGNFERR